MLYEVITYSEWIQGMFKIPSAEYSKLTQTFNPKDFDADLIVKTAKDAGMKYLVVTSKHHEGFCLWDSVITSYSIHYTKLYDLFLSQGQSQKRRLPSVRH